jgi:shikimate kinase
MMRKQENVFLVGPMGAGKSTIGRSLAKALQRSFYDTDQFIEDRSGVTIAWIYDIEGDDGLYRREEDAVDELTQMSGIVLATGAGVVSNPKNCSMLAARGVVIYLKVSIGDQLERMRLDSKRHLLQTSDRENVLRQLQLEREHVYQEIADYTFDTTCYNINSLTREIVCLLAEGQ